MLPLQKKRETILIYLNFREINMNTNVVPQFDIPQMTYIFIPPSNHPLSPPTSAIVFFETIIDSEVFCKSANWDATDFFCSRVSDHQVSIQAKKDMSDLNVLAVLRRVFGWEEVDRKTRFGY